MLEYHGRPMRSEPVSGYSLLHVADALNEGEPVVVALEPGDHTNYTLLIVPAWAKRIRGQLVRFGITSAHSRDYLLVTKLGDQQGETFYATSDVGAWDLHGIDNDWTRELLVWWLRILWEQITLLRKV